VSCEIENKGELMSGFSAILFDFDGTIRHSRPRGIDIFHKLAFELGVSITDEVKIEAERWSHKYFAMSDELKDDTLESGGTLEGEFWLKFARRHLKLLGAPEDYLDELSMILTEKMGIEYQPEDYVALDVLPTLELLRSSGYQLGLVSNRSHSITELLEKLGLDKIFHIALTAGEVGIWKPDPGLFEHVLRFLKTAPKKTVYVGDNYYADVLGARAANLVPVLYDPQGIYPGPGCPAIRTMGDLRMLLQSSEPLLAED
jgi:putative hydrolase of the HAD superfamily